MVEDIAKERDAYSKTLSDSDIYRAVVRNAIKLEADTATKAQILLSSVPDVGIIYAQLKLNHRIGDLSNEDFHDILEACITNIEDKKKLVDFNPLHIKDNEKVENS